MAFTGHAVYDSGVHDEIAESVSAVITDISPYETPFLDWVGDADQPARHVHHEWLEDQLAPNRVTIKAALASNVSGGNVVTIDDNFARLLQPGTILTVDEQYAQAGETTGEHMRVTSNAVAHNQIYVERAFAGTKANSYHTTPTVYMAVVTNASLDGSDVTVDSSRARTRLYNYTQIFKEDVIISGTSQSMEMLGGIGVGELDHQISKKLKEALRNLERAAISSRLSGNSIGSGTAVRTMNGLLGFITSNVQTYQTSVSSPAAQFEVDLIDAIELAWQNGGTDLDTILVGAKLKRSIDQLNSSRIRTVNVDSHYGNNIYQFTCAYGEFRIMMSRWMPASTAAIIAKSRIKIAPLQNRSFSWVPIGKRGDWDGGMIIGEYTMELRNQAGMAVARFPRLGSLYSP